MAYATVEDVQARMSRQMTTEEQDMCKTLLEDAALLIDAYASCKTEHSAKQIVSSRVVARMMSDDGSSGFPVGATQGSMSGLGYAQSWTIGSGGATGEMYLTKVEKKMLGIGNRIGSKSPVEDVSGRRWPRWWVRT